MDYEGRSDRVLSRMYVRSGQPRLQPVVKITARAFDRGAGGPDGVSRREEEVETDARQLWGGGGFYS